jgi:hypothetical protein
MKFFRQWLQMRSPYAASENEFNSPRESAQTSLSNCAVQVSDFDRSRGSGNADSVPDLQNGGTTFVKVTKHKASGDWAHTECPSRN